MTARVCDRCGRSLADWDNGISYQGKHYHVGCWELENKNRKGADVPDDLPKVEEPKMDLTPRNDFVLIREERVGSVRGVIMPDVAVQGRKYLVVACGPKVTDLKVGEQVMMTGQKGVDWSPIPNFPDLLIIREANVVLRITPAAPPASAYEQVADGHHDFHG